MVYIRFKSLSLICCLIVAGWLLLAQVLANTVLLLACLLAFVALVLWSCVKGVSLPILLFFLPWAPLIRLEPGTTSVYTISLLMVLCVSLFVGNKNEAYLGHVLPAVLLAFLTFIVKLCYGYDITNTYILFIAFLLFFPMLVQEIECQRYDFYDLTVFFSLGIIVAALASQYLIEYPTISRFIEVHDQVSYVRYGGFYGDPNFYSAHITAAMAGIMILISERCRIRRRLILMILLAVLSYCGFLSLSKTFVVVVACLFLFWALQVLFQRRKASTKLFFMFFILILGIFIVSTTVFDTMLSRLIDSSGSLSDLTTGRVNIWMNYLSELGSKPLLLLFGTGYTRILIEARDAHNTLIQTVYQFGIVGSIVFVFWIKSYVKTALNTVKMKKEMFLPLTVLIFGVIGPWLSLDILFFDEFFLLSFFIFAGVRYLSDLNELDQSR